MRRALVVGAFLALFALLAPARGAVPSSALRRAPDHWRDFVAMEPPIRLPRTRLLRDRTTVFLRIVGDGRLDVRDGALVFPPGTEADRVEYRRLGERFTVADVRGTRFTTAGERFYAFRPERAELDGPLFGFEWRRGDERGRRLGIEGFERAMHRGAGFSHGEVGYDERERDRSVRRFAGLLDCASCHGHARPEAQPYEASPLPRRGTDGSGMHVFRYVLTDEAPMETYRPIDPNADDAFVRFVCGDGSTPDGPRGTTRVRCANGDVPTLRYALREALAAGEPHARAVCESRRALAGWMTARARRAYRDALTECGLTDALSFESQ